MARSELHRHSRLYILAGQRAARWPGDPRLRTYLSASASRCPWRTPTTDGFASSSSVCAYRGAHASNASEIPSPGYLSSMKLRTRARTPTSIASNQSSKSNHRRPHPPLVVSHAAACVSVSSVATPEPFGSSNPETHANPIPTTSATRPRDGDFPRRLQGQRVWVVCKEQGFPLRVREADL